MSGPSRARTFTWTRGGMVMVFAFGGPALFPPRDAAEVVWQVAVVLCVLAMCMLAALHLYVRNTTVANSGRLLVHTGLFGRRREIEAERVTEVVGQTFRLFDAGPALRIVAFRADRAITLRLFAVLWDLDELDDLADAISAPVRNEQAPLFRNPMRRWRPDLRVA